MNRKTSALCISLLLLCAFAFQNLTTVRSVTEEEETQYYINSTVTYLNKGDKPWNFTEEDRTVGLFMNNSWQTAYMVNSTPSVETIKNDTDGNHVAVLQFPEMLLNPGQNVSYAVTNRIVSKPRTLGDINEAASGSLNEIPPEFLKEKYLGAEGPWLVNNTELKNLARSITGTETKPLTIVKNFVAWIANNIDYAETHEFPFYPNETLIERKGDCDDQAILLVTLCRIIGVPAFLQIGAIYDLYQSWKNTSYWEDHVMAVQKRIGWHGWAMVYVPPWGWLPVELTYVFGLRDNPLNAITNAAVTLQITIQYMNISQTDHVASSREARDFLITNSFYVYTEDEMMRVVRQENPFGESVERLAPVFLVVAAALLLTGSYVIARRWKRQKETPNDLTKR